MNVIKLLFIFLYLVIGTIQAQMPAPTSCLRLEGIVIDYSNQQPLSDAKLFAKLPTSRKRIGSTSDSGQFLIEAPCEAIAILIERAGYRPQLIPLLQSKPQRVITLIPLVAIERQGNDKTYLQTEQTHYVQQSSEERVNKADSITVQHGAFAVTDAVRNTPLQAQTCFFFTKNGAKKCVSTDLKGHFNFDFDQADIVAVEVSAAGYQTYAGNLVVESLDGRLVEHKIQLQRELTLLSVRADSVTNCELHIKDQTFTLINIPGHSGWFSSFEILPGRYELAITKHKRVVKQFIKLSSGLNYVDIVKSKSDATVHSAFIGASTGASHINESPIQKLNLPKSIPMIYFEQGSYQLRIDSQEVLREVATYLKNNQQFLLQVEGHTDNIGNERLNKSLSEFRAAVTANFLIRLGIDENKLNKAGYGSQFPISPNDTEVNKALNRRVSLKLIATQ